MTAESRAQDFEAVVQEKLDAMLLPFCAEVPKVQWILDYHFLKTWHV